jgi:hypothetical protein
MDARADGILQGPQPRKSRNERADTRVHSICRCKKSGNRIATLKPSARNSKQEQGENITLLASQLLDRRRMLT